MTKLFKLKENGTKISTELIAGLTTFLSMAYIIAVNPSILSDAGMEWDAVFLATILASVIGTLIIGLLANAPYAIAPGMGMNTFFVQIVCKTLGFTWQQALSMVFISGVINSVIFATRFRKHILTAIPANIRYALSGGIGLFIAYTGLLNAGVVNFRGGVPALSPMDSPSLWLFLFGLLIIFVLLLMNQRFTMYNCEKPLKTRC